MSTALTSAQGPAGHDNAAGVFSHAVEAAAPDDEPALVDEQP
jgi:hypothetical protein